MPTLTADKYKIVWKMNGEMEVHVESNYVATSDDSTITNEQYLPPSSSIGVSIEEG